MPLNKGIVKTPFKRQKSVKLKKQFLENVSNLKGCTSENLLKIISTACLLDREDVLHSLIHEYNPDINEQDENGDTALFYAVLGRSVDCVDLLLRYDADIYHRNKNGDDVTWIAVSKRSFNLVEKLIRRTRPRDEILTELVNKAIVAKDALGLSLLADFDRISLDCAAGQTHFRDKRGHAPIQYAIYKSLDKSVKKLVLSGAKVSTLKEYIDLSLKSEISWKCDVFMFPMISGCTYENLFSNMNLKWWIIDRSTRHFEMGKDIRELLEIVKNSNSLNRYIICRHFNDHEVELIHYVKTLSFMRVFIFNSVLDFIPEFSGTKWFLLNNCTLPKEIDLTNFKSLRYLSLVSMGLQTVPNSIQYLKNLKFLNLSFNKLLEVIPTWISELPVTHLYINNNSISDIPTVLPNCLKILKLHNNKIREINPMLSTMRNLIYISLHGNPISFPNIPSVISDTTSLKRFLAQYLDDTIPTAFTKVAVIGKERVGKSTLCRALMSTNSKFDNGEDILKTDGLDIHSVKLNKHCEIKLFDLAGDIDYFESHVMLLTDDTTYLATFDLRSYALSFTKHDFFSRIESWLSVIHTQTNNSRVILVGTHADADTATKDILESIWKNVYAIILRSRKLHQEKYTDDLCDTCYLCSSSPLTRTIIDEHFGYVQIAPNVTETDGANDQIDSNFDAPNHCFPHITGYFEVSSVKSIPRKLLSSNNVSILNLKEAIINCCTEINKHHETVPRKWNYLKIALLEKAAAKNFPILEYRTLRNSFTNLTETSGEDFDFCLKYFHSKGELLYFPEQSHSKGIIVTDPKWLSLRLCTVLSYKNVPQVINGVITHENLNSLWNDLPPEYFSFLIEVFRKVRIFIPMDESSELIPTRLPIGIPDNNQWPKTTKENEISVLYQFDFLPLSLFSFIMAEVSRFIAHAPAMKMQPLFLGNCIVFMNVDEGIPCQFHAPIVNQTNINPIPSGFEGIYDKGIYVPDFLDFRKSRDLLNVHRNSTVITFKEIGAESMDISFLKKSATLHRVKIEALPHLNSLQVSIRGVKPCCILPIISGMISNSVAKISAYLKYECFLMCPACVKMLVKNPSKFSIKEIKSFLPVCSIGHNLESWDNILTGKCSAEYSLTVSQVTNAITEFECPKLFVLLPINLQSVEFKDFVTFTYFKEGFAVHLLCEAPNAWHFLDSVGYRVARPKKFVKTYGKRLQTLINVLIQLEIPTKIASTFCEPLEGIDEGFSSLKNIADTLDAHLRDFSEEWSFLKEDSLDTQMEFLESNDGLHRRELARFLNKNDEERRFGDLSPCFINERVHWLCQRCYKQYSEVVS